MNAFNLHTAIESMEEYRNGVDALENGAMLEQEREDVTPAPAVFPCPEILAQGRVGEIAARLGKWGFEVWLGTMCALGAIAHKNLHWHYYRPLYGMLYGLLISPTGQGKGLCTDLCRALVPDWYTVRRSVQSGPALFPILAAIEKDTKGKIVSITPRPALLVLEEWTALLKASKIEFSNLQDTLNELFHTPFPFNLSRSDSDSGGGDRTVQNATLSICATTTGSLLHQEVTDRMVRSGFLNRYFVVPGSHKDWHFYDEEQAGTDVRICSHMLSDLVGYSWGAGQNVWRAYSLDAKDRLRVWGELTFKPIMHSSAIEAESIKRLHTYVHIIALLYAYAEKAPLVTLPHVEAAIAAVSVSKAFVESLMGPADAVEVPKFKRYEMSLHEKILDKVEKEPGITCRNIAEDLRKSGTYPDIVATIRKLATADGPLTITKTGKKETVFCRKK